MKIVVSVLALIVALAPAVRASNEDFAINARGMAMAGSGMAEPGGLSGLILNPASLGDVRRPLFEMGIRRLFHAPVGPVDISGMALGAAIPIDGDTAKGALGVSWTQDINEPVALDRMLGLTYATRSWREIGAGILDVGISLKAISRSSRKIGARSSKATVDIGTIFRWGEDQTIGFSMLNLTRPLTSVADFDDRAPFIAKLGYARKVRRFTVVADLTKREGSGGRFGSGGLSGGMEYAWATAKQGLITVRNGIILGGLSRSYSAGLGWSTLGARVDYAVRVPLSHGSRWSHAFSISYRFGQWDPEEEYERLLSSELSYRRDLSRALEAAEVKQWKLAEELRMMREEISDLRIEVADREAEAGEAQRIAADAARALRLKELEERRRGAQARLEKLRRDQERMRLANKQALFNEDWKTFSDLKLQGVAEVVLIDFLKKILRSYKGTGVDLGRANRELQRLNRR
ncbi:MAG: hypothetical protein COB53_00780 [Elusimicrobia bacterium]|nr:MAG: hypothetical protein COB53_00780 [Elusimicrobiota bacterium]